MALPRANPRADSAESWRDLFYLFRYLAPWRGEFTVAMVALLISMSFGLMFPFLVGYLLDAALPSVKHIPPPEWLGNVDRIALVLIATLVIQAALTFFSSYTFNRVGERAVVSLRRRLFGHLISMPMKFFGEHRVGELASRLSADIGLLEEMLISAVPQALRQVMLLCGGVVIIAATSLRLSLVMLSSFPVVMLVAVVFGRRIRRLSRVAQDRLAETGTIIDETLQGIANVKAFGNERFEVERYRSQLSEFLASILRTARFRAGLIAFIIVAIFGSIVLVLWDGAHLMQSGALTHGELTRFVFCTIFVGGAVSSMAEIFSAMQRAIGATQRVRELLEEAPEPTLADDAHANAMKIRLRGDVIFDDVHFRYPSRPDLPVLRGLSLHAKAGEQIALVGPSGAGKSTIVALLLRFYEPDQGCIRLDGRDARDLPFQAVRANMAIVPQEVLLFGGSIRDNIAYGKPGATDEEIVAASRGANCHEFVERFPEGYATIVGERGVQLSGGQRQRIA
ncbi:MAG TPA: ABC transporter transmembrane domain-containing protein, partial [Chthoniobacteraceae bacterium]|nr:ABC transporter transmembrane domain-containing protein [Chthoniobacteraceae bacterium]